MDPNKVAIVIAVFGALISIAVSVGSGLWSYHVNMATQNRQTQIERVDKFSNNSSLSEAAAAFIGAMQASRDLSPAREKFASAIGQQVISTNDLKVSSSATTLRLVQQYQASLQELAGLTQKVGQPTEMRPWAESFGRALDNRATLSDQLRLDLDRRT